MREMMAIIEKTHSISLKREESIERFVQFASSVATVVGSDWIS